MLFVRYWFDDVVVIWSNIGLVKSSGYLSRIAQQFVLKIT